MQAGVRATPENLRDARVGTWFTYGCQDGLRYFANDFAAAQDWAQELCLRDGRGFALRVAEEWSRVAELAAERALTGWRLWLWRLLRKFERQSCP
jgi:hypothetical protein